MYRTVANARCLPRCLGHRAHVQEEFLVPWAVPVLGTPGGKWSLYLWSRDQKSVAWLHRVGLMAFNYLRTFVFVLGEPVSEAHIRTMGVVPDREDRES
jgi:hypothetical protein